jgi:hypothetical protein
LVEVPNGKIPMTNIAGIDAAVLESDEEKSNADAADA